MKPLWDVLVDYVATMVLVLQRESVGEAALFVVAQPPPSSKFQPSPHGLNQVVAKHRLARANTTKTPASPGRRGYPRSFSLWASFEKSQMMFGYAE